MSALQLLQKDFQSFILHGGRHMNRQVVDTSKVSAEARLDVYYQAYRLRLLEALGVDFPALLELVGKERFERLGREYIDAYPSEHFSIRYFGRAVSRYLASACPDKPWLAELAAFEWALGFALDAADVPPLTEKSLSGIPAANWPELRFRFHPSVQRLDFDWHVPAVWLAVDRHETPTAPARNEPPMPWLVWRRDLRNYFRSLNTDEAWALDAIRSGQSFGDICEGLCQWHNEDDVATRAASLLKLWVEEDLLTHAE